MASVAAQEAPPSTFEQECVLFFEETVQLFGVPKSVGQIYGLLYASPEPLGFADIVERLDISKGSASQGLQLLRSLGAINEAERPSEISNRGSASRIATRSSRTGAASASQISNQPSGLGSSQISDQASQIATRGSRGVAYEPELSLRQLVTGILRERVAPMAGTGGERLKRMKTLAELSPEHTKFYSGRAKQLETWRKRFTTVLPLLTALLGPKKKRR